MEKYTISIGNGFTIENKKYLDKIGNAIDTSLAKFEAIDEVVSFIHNPFPISDDFLENIKDNELLQKDSSFEIHLLKNSEWKKQEGFDGTLLDALEYVKENFKDE